MTFNAEMFSAIAQYLKHDLGCQFGAGKLTGRKSGQDRFSFGSDGGGWQLRLKSRHRVDSARQTAVPPHRRQPTVRRDRRPRSSDRLSGEPLVKSIDWGCAGAAG